MSKPASFPGRVPSNPDLRGVHEAMHKAAATARRRAARTSAALSASERSQLLLAGVDEGNPAFDTLLGPALNEAERALVFAANNLNNTIPGLGNSKRLQLAAGCLHMVLEHAQSITVLTEDKCFGSALALQRSLHETLWRSLWLRYAATDAQVDDTDHGKFPLQHDVIQGLNRAFKEHGRPPYAKGDFWRLLCRHAYGGHPDVRARLMTDGLEAHYTLRELTQALWFAGMAQLAAATELASMGGDESLAVKVLDRLKAYVASTDQLAAATETDA